MELTDFETDGLTIAAGWTLRAIEVDAATTIAFGQSLVELLGVQLFEWMAIGQAGRSSRQVGAGMREVVNGDLLGMHAATRSLTNHYIVRGGVKKNLRLQRRVNRRRSKCSTCNC